VSATSGRRYQPTDYPEYHTHPLPIALEAAVPLWIAELRLVDDEAFARLFELAQLDELAHVIAGGGDAVLFRSPTRGKSRDVFNAVAKGIALLSFCPGGITIFGRTWVASRCAAAEAAG
jgi:hypothetical protein